MVDNLSVVEQLSLDARKSISNYCFTECNAYCCRKGYLKLSPKEANLLTNNMNQDFKKKEILISINGGRYVLDLGVQGCPQLKDNKCTIHTNENRPLACKEFPLFICGKKTIRLSRRCPAVTENMLYPYIAQFKSLGYTILYGNDNFRE